MEYIIRRIEPKDDKIVEKIIRDCLIEYGGNHEGTAWEDSYLGQFSSVYDKDNNAYWVAEDETGTLVGGVGIGPLEGDTCELQKMYCTKAGRGVGVSKRLLDEALSFAKQHYSKCYLETLENMVEARRFYEKYGFERVIDAIGSTGHEACDIRYIKDL